MKKYINEIQVIAFCGLITFIFLIISLEFLEWAINFSFWEGALGVVYLSLNLVEKLATLWFLGTPLYFVKIIFERKWYNKYIKVLMTSYLVFSIYSYFASLISWRIEKLYINQNNIKQIKIWIVLKNVFRVTGTALLVAHLLS